MANPNGRAIWKTLLALSLALWSGGSVFFSFIVAPRIFGHLRDELPANPPPGLHGLNTEIGRRLAGDTVGAIFPAYFTAQIVVGGVAAVASFVQARRGSRADRIGCGLAVAALLLVTIHFGTVYRRSVATRAEEYVAQAAGDSKREAELHRSFGMLHGISQTLNVLTISLVLAATVLAALPQREPS